LGEVVNSPSGLARSLAHVGRVDDEETGWRLQPSLAPGQRLVELDLANDIIFKGATVLGISGRLIFDTWYRTRRILESGQLDLKQVITHTLPFEQIHEAMEIMKSGDCGKIVLTL